VHTVAEELKMAVFASYWEGWKKVSNFPQHRRSVTKLTRRFVKLYWLVPEKERKRKIRTIEEMGRCSGEQVPA